MYRQPAALDPDADRPVHSLASSPLVGYVAGTAGAVAVVGLAGWTFAADGGFLAVTILGGLVGVVLLVVAAISFIAAGSAGPGRTSPDPDFLEDDPADDELVLL